MLGMPRSDIKLRRHDIAGTRPGAEPQTVGFLLLPDFALLSYASAIEPLRAANRLSGMHASR
jgi:transcriptional regulator GlxA family with amidase domain